MIWQILSVWAVFFTIVYIHIKAISVLNRSKWDIWEQYIVECMQAPDVYSKYWCRYAQRLFMDSREV